MWNEKIEAILVDRSLELTSLNCKATSNPMHCSSKALHRFVQYDAKARHSAQRLLTPCSKQAADTAVSYGIKCKENLV